MQPSLVSSLHMDLAQESHSNHLDVNATASMIETDKIQNFKSWLNVVQLPNLKEEENSLWLLFTPPAIIKHVETKVRHQHDLNPQPSDG